jgi:hypothetical protein
MKTPAMRLRIIPLVNFNAGQIVRQNSQFSNTKNSRHLPGVGFISNKLAALMPNRGLDEPMNSMPESMAIGFVSKL